jgi:hypothetical protein
VRGLLRLALGLLVLLISVRVWALVAGRRAKGVYFLSGARQIRLLFWPLAGLVASLPFTLAAVRRLADLPFWAQLGVGGLAVVLLSLSLPALVLHARYQRHDGGTVVLFDARTNWFEIRRPNQPAQPLFLSTIYRVTYVRPRAQRAFWSDYETLLLEFGSENAPPILLTSAVMDLAPVVAWLRTGRVPVVEARRWLAWA